jgi:ribosomal protein S18 acetylase RimI-like enzyme
MQNKKIGSANMIRFAKKEELVHVNELRIQVSAVHAKGRPDIFRDDFCKELQDSICDVWENNESDVIVAIRDGQICGFASVEYIDKPLSPYTLAGRYYHIKEFGVDERFRRQKVATELFDFIKAQAKEKGFDKIELDVWEFNEGAVKFYESVGLLTYRRYMEFENK